MATRASGLGFVKESVEPPLPTANRSLEIEEVATTDMVPSTSTARCCARRFVWYAPMSYMAGLSVLAAFCFGCFLSLFAVFSAASIASVTSALSVASANSALSILSVNSFLSIGCVNGYMEVCAPFDALF